MVRGTLRGDGHVVSVSGDTRRGGIHPALPCRVNHDDVAWGSLLLAMLSVGDDIKSEGWRAGTHAVEPGTRGVWEVEVRRRSATTANLLRNGSVTKRLLSSHCFKF